MGYLQTVFLFYFPLQLLYQCDIYKHSSCSILIINIMRYLQTVLLFYILINCFIYEVFTNSILVLFFASITLPDRYLQTVFLFYIFAINWATYAIFTNSHLVLYSLSIALLLRYSQSSCFIFLINCSTY